MTESFIEIDANNKISLNGRQVLVVLGKLDNNVARPDEISFWRRRTIAWSHYYVNTDSPLMIKKTMDKNIRKIIQKESEAFLNKFHLWEATPF